MPGPTPIAERVRKYSSPANDRGCIEWLGSRDENGYGRVHCGGTPRLAHRVAWELENGPIPSGLCVLHGCDNPPCINPSHMFLGTQADNMRDMVKKGRQANATKTHCKYGHPYSPENTYHMPAGGRDCRECMRERRLKWSRYNKAVTLGFNLATASGAPQQSSQP